VKASDKKPKDYFYLRGKNGFFPPSPPLLFIGLLLDCMVKPGPEPLSLSLSSEVGLPSGSCPVCFFLRFFYFLFLLQQRTKDVWSFKATSAEDIEVKGST
jgi:hypothetical protein